MGLLFRLDVLVDGSTSILRRANAHCNGGAGVLVGSLSRVWGNKDGGLPMEGTSTLLCG